jgi:hypothetical protein
MERVVEAVELRNHRRPLPVLDDAGVPQVADLAARNPDGDRDLQAAPLERSRATCPGGGEVEVGRASKRLRALTGGHDPRHPVDALLTAAPREQVPDAGFEDEPEWVEATRYDHCAFSVAHVETPAAPERSGDDGQVRDTVLFAKPPARVDVEQPRGAAGALLQLRRQRRKELQPRGGELAAEAEAVLVARDGDSGASRPLTDAERTALERSVSPGTGSARSAGA